MGGWLFVASWRITLTLIRRVALQLTARQDA